MARGNGFVSFIQGFGLGRQMFQDYQAAKDRQDIEKIANEAPQQSQGFTAEDGQQLEALANAKDEKGDPFYQLTAAEDGSYKVTPNFTVQGADGQQQAAPVATVAQRGVTDFLGKRTAGSMTDDQVSGARQRAIAGVIMRSNPAAGAQMLNNVALQERDTQRFGWEKATQERQLAKNAQADDDEAAVRDADAQAAEWLKSRLVGPDGATRAATVEDHLAATQFRAFKLAEGGRLNEASQAYKDYAAQSYVKLQMETQQREVAIGKTAAALAAGDLDAVKTFYNDFIPDGAKVTDVKRDKGGQIVISRETLDGRKLPQTVMKDTGQLVSALAAFKDPMTIYHYAQNEFRNTLALRADVRAGAAEGRAAAEFNAGAPQRQLASTVATLQLGLGNTDDPTQRSQIQGKLTAIQGGLAQGKDQPAEVKLASAMLQAGMAPDMRSALELAVSKKSQAPEDMHKEFVTAGIKNMAKPADAVKAADEVMASMGYVKSGGRWSQGKGAQAPAAPGAPATGAVPAADKRVVGQAYDTPKGRMIWRGTGWEPAP